MTREQIAHALRLAFPKVDIQIDESNEQGLVVPAASLHALVAHLKVEPSLDFVYNMVITAADWLDRVDVIYYFMSYRHQHIVALKVQLPDTCLEVQSVADLYASANWFEREVYDLFGVRFIGHPDPRRIMMPSDWEGHPLRKSYKHPNLVPLPEKENPAALTGMGHHSIY